MTIEVFELFRNALFAVVGGYYLLVTVGGLLRMRQLLKGSDPTSRMMRTVVSYLVATASLRPVVGELRQIILLLFALVTIWWAHGLVEVVG